MESVSSNSPNEGIDFEQNPFIYGSGYHDTESSLEYMGARYYSADIGRFVAQDSFDLLNRYNYGNANPIMTIDPDGHLAISYLLDAGLTLFSTVINAMIGNIPGVAVDAGNVGFLIYLGLSEKENNWTTFGINAAMNVLSISLSFVMPLTQLGAGNIKAAVSLSRFNYYRVRFMTDKTFNILRFITTIIATSPSASLNIITVLNSTKNMQKSGVKSGLRQANHEYGSGLISLV